jgi:NAD(P)-dependent dehydrogenase (short-subunit alcohol dehydrogenase family)
MSLLGIVDGVLEAPIVTSFTNVGYHLRSRLHSWEPLESFDMTGATVVVTGATSGLGRHAAQRFAELGASVVVSGRNRDKTERARDEIAAATGSTSLDVAVADMGELDQVRALASAVASRHEHIDVLVNNAGSLSAERHTNTDGIEATIASQVLGPFLLTTLLSGPLRRSAPGRVVTVSSGGMYAAGLTVRSLQMGAEDYSGSEQYARAKRAQVTLNEMWAERTDPGEIVFHAMHPGWADTPGVAASLPTFRKVTLPFLRSAEQGADTIVWLGAADEPAASTGGFWLDRRRRSIHRLPSTRRTDTAEHRAALWQWCVQQTAAHVA